MSPHRPGKQRLYLLNRKGVKDKKETILIPSAMLDRWLIDWYRERSREDGFTLGVCAHKQSRSLSPPGLKLRERNI